MLVGNGSFQTPLGTRAVVLVLVLVLAVVVVFVVVVAVVAVVAVAAAGARFPLKTLSTKGKQKNWVKIKQHEKATEKKGIIIHHLKYMAGLAK